MAASQRPDCRSAKIGEDSSRKSRTRRGSHGLRALKRQIGCTDLYLESAREHITVALTSRGRGQLHRPRGMSTRIRALVHEAVGASGHLRVIYKEAPGRQR
jgi:hypothetical protein